MTVFEFARRNFMRFGLGGLGGLIGPSIGWGQASRTSASNSVKLIVPYAAGGATDIVARAVAEKLGAQWNKTVVIDNKPGAGTTLAASQVAKASGDGDTLYMTTSAHTISASVYKKLDYDPLRDFAPITLIAKVPLVLVVRPELNIKTLSEFITYARSNTGKVNFASPGNGTAQHLTGEMFNTAQRVRMTHIPYKGDAPAITDLMGGAVEAMFATLTVVLGHIASGKLRAIAIANGARVEKVPDIPTFSELGMKGFEAATWFGVLGPSAMSKSLAEQLSKDIRSVVNQSEMRQKLIDLGGEVVANSPIEFDHFMREEAKKWHETVKASGATVS